MNMYNALHPRDSVARLFLPRKVGVRGLISIEDCVDLAVLGVNDYVTKSNERLIVAASPSGGGNQEGTEGFKRRKFEERSKELREKELHGQFFRQTEQVAATSSWQWLTNEYLKKETEGLWLPKHSP